MSEQPNTEPPVENAVFDFLKGHCSDFVIAFNAGGQIYRGRWGKASTLSFLNLVIQHHALEGMDERIREYLDETP